MHLHDEKEGRGGSGIVRTCGVISNKWRQPRRKMKIQCGRRCENLKNDGSYDRGRFRTLWCSLMSFFNSRAQCKLVANLFFQTVEAGAVQGGKGGRPCPSPPFVALGSSVRHNDSATFARAAAAKLMHYSREGGLPAAGSPWGPPPSMPSPPAEWLHFTLRSQPWEEPMVLVPKYASESEVT